MDKIWLTKDNFPLAVKDMATDHITNCIRFIKSGKSRLTRAKALEWIETFTKELERRNSPSFSMTLTEKREHIKELVTNLSKLGNK